MKISLNKLFTMSLLVVSALTTINVSIFKTYDRYAIYTVPIIMFLTIRGTRKCKDDNRIMIVMLFYSFLCIGLNLILKNYGIGSLLNTLLMIFFYIFLKNNSNLKSKDFKLLFIVYFCICLMISLVSKKYGAMHYASIISGNESYVNPNFVAFMICIISFILWIMIKEYRFKNKFVSTLLSLIILLVNIISINNLQSRSSYLAIMFFFAISYFFPEKWMTKKNALILYWGIIVLTIVIPIIYIYMYKYGISIDSVGGISKRTFTGRENIWINYTSEFKSIFQFLFGLGSKSTISGASDMHNCTLSLFKNGGIVLTSIVYLFFYRQIILAFEDKNLISKEKFIYIIAFISTFIIGCFESTFINSQVYFLMCLFIVQARKR